jgi:hypothetical protein
VLHDVWSVVWCAAALYAEYTAGYTAALADARVSLVVVPFLSCISCYIAASSKAGRPSALKETQQAIKTRIRSLNNTAVYSVTSSRHAHTDVLAVTEQPSPGAIRATPVLPSQRGQGRLPFMHTASRRQP